ncbi:MAG: hypothetical protein QOJ12_1877 [Thermoleophilales bacterium]|nr:hypothetical protein [Thermoleophilales bacterium]
MGSRNALRRGSIASAGILAGALGAAAPPAAAQTSPICSVTGSLPVVGTVTNCPPASGVTIPGVTVGTTTLPGVDASTGATGSGVSTTGSGVSGQRDTRAPRARLSARRGRLSLALLKGYSVVVFCDEACTVKGELAQSGRRATLGRGSARIATPGKGKVKLRFTRSARKALRRTASAKLTIRVTVIDAAGNAATRRLAVTLRG